MTRIEEPKSWGLRGRTSQALFFAVVFLFLAALPSPLGAQLIYTYEALDETVEYDVTTGLRQFEMIVTLSEDPANPDYPNAIGGFTMAIAHDSGIVQAVSADAGDYLQSLNDGDGPEFFASGESDDGSGFIVSVIVHILDIFPFPPGSEAIDMTYVTIPDSLQGSADTVVTALSFQDLLFQGMTITNQVFSYQPPVPAELVDGQVMLVPTDPFRRGDVNDDGLVGIADPILAIEFLFGSGSEPGCLDAIDVNDDGSGGIDDVILSLNYQFLGGAPPAAPGPLECGVDPTLDALAACQYSGC